MTEQLTLLWTSYFRFLCSIVLYSIGLYFHCQIYPQLSVIPLWPSCFILSGAIIIQDTCREIKRFTTQKNVLKSVQVEAYWKNTFGRSKGDYWVQKKWFGLAKCRRHGVWYSVLHDLSSYLGHDCCDCGLFSQKKEQKMLSDIRSRNIWI